MRQLLMRRSLSSVAASPLLKNSAFVGGNWVSAESVGKQFEVLDPANGKAVAVLPDMDAQHCRVAIEAAAEAFKTFRLTTAKERAGVLRRVAEMHHANVNVLAEILAMESGKPMAEARGEILYGASYFEWFAEEAKRIYGDVIPPPFPRRQIFTFREPVGVCGLITPWNFPNAMIARKAAPAIAAGCTVVIKPAAETPLSTLAIAQMCKDAGLPDGVLNVVTSSNAAAIGNTLSEDSRVRKISFTGSTRVGKLLMKQSADTVKKVSMELGGDAPFIVFDDADLDLAVQGFMDSKFRNCGQTCVCANRIFVHDKVYEEFVRRVVERVENLKVGRFNEDGVTIGPLISSVAVDKVDDMVQDAVGKGAKIATGGSRLKADSGGYFFAPTILTECDSTMRVAQEEIFGPVAPFIRFTSDEWVIDRANATRAGLAAYFFTNDTKRTFNVSQRLEYGMVGCNTGIISTEVSPFGGIKESGLGREGSKYGIDEYVHVKAVTIQL